MATPARDRPVAQQMGIHPGSRAFLSNIPPDVRTALHLPELDLSPALAGDFDYLHLFVTTRVDLNAAFPRFRDQLRPRGMLWVSWPKAGQFGSDLTLPDVVSIGHRHGLVDSTCLNVNDTWSALKFTWPKAGQTRVHDHARLPDRRT